MAFIDKSTLWLVKEEASYGAGATFDVATDMVEFIGATMDGEIEQIDREVIKNSLIKAKSVPGKKTCSGTLPIEISAATGDAGAAKINGDLLYTSAVGKRIGDTVSEVPTADSSVSVTVSDASDYQVGQAIKLTKGANSQVAVIRTIDTTTDVITFSPAHTLGSTLTGVRGLVSFVVNAPGTSTPSLAVQEYLEDGSSKYKYTYKGVKVSALALDFPMANICKASFTVAGAGFDVGTATDLGKQCVSVSPLVAKNMVFIYDGDTYEAKDLSVKIDTDLYDVESITSEGISNKIETGKGGVTGSFKTEFKDLTLFNKFQANTTGELVAKGTALGGKQFGVYAPAVIINKSNKTTDSSVYHENVEFQCVSSDACVDGVEDAITLWFEN